MNNNSEKIKKTLKDIFNFIVGMILIISIVIGFVKIGGFLTNAIKEIINKYPTIAVALITGLLAFISVPVGKYFENRYTIKNEIRKKREIIYIEFLNWLIKNVLNGEISNNENIINELKENQNKMVIYASDNVLKAWTKFRNTALNINYNNQLTNKEEKTKRYLNNEAVEVEKLILAIRKELGYNNKDIKQYDILRLYINDIDNYIQEK